MDKELGHPSLGNGIPIQRDAPHPLNSLLTAPTWALVDVWGVPAGAPALTSPCCYCNFDKSAQQAGHVVTWASRSGRCPGPGSQGSPGCVPNPTALAMVGPVGRGWSFLVGVPRASTKATWKMSQRPPTHTLGLDTNWAGANGLPRGPGQPQARGRSQPGGKLSGTRARPAAVPVLGTY